MGVEKSPGLMWGENPNREPGKIHIEWHAPCGCAFHPNPFPHIHPCTNEHKRPDLQTVGVAIVSNEQQGVAFTAYNQAIEDAMAAIRGEKVNDPYAAPTFINAIARKCSPHVYVNRLAAASSADMKKVVRMTDNRTEEIRSRLNRFGQFTPTEDDVRYLLSRLDAEEETPEDELGREQIVQAITDIQEARESHVQWANHLRNEKHAPCEGCNDFAAHIGDAEYHDEWIAKYDNVIAVLARVPFSAAATAAPKVSNDLLRDAGAIIIVNEGSAGARVEIRFAELQDAQRLHQALAQMRVAAPVDHNSIPLIGYERILTIEWDKYNARRHELIKAERSRVLSESEVLELFELQWLARIKHGLSSGPRVTQKQALPDHFLCINPEEQPIVINFLRGYGTDAERELARLHLNLCLRCQELANAAPVEQSDSSIPTCPDCQQGYICEHCGKSIIDYYSGNEGTH